MSDRAPNRLADIFLVIISVYAAAMLTYMAGKESCQDNRETISEQTISKTLQGIQESLERIANAVEHKDQSCEAHPRPMSKCGQTVRSKHLDRDNRPK